jgi:hypothetical protein
MIYYEQGSREKDMKTPKSEVEIGMEEIIKECEDIVDENYLTTNDAKRLINHSYKLLEKCKELRISRDKWKSKYDKLKEFTK